MLCIKIVGHYCSGYFAETRRVQVSPRYRLSERPQIPVPYFRQKAAAQLPAGDAAGLCQAACLTSLGKVRQCFSDRWPGSEIGLLADACSSIWYQVPCWRIWLTAANYCICVSGCCAFCLGCMHRHQSSQLRSHAASPSYTHDIFISRTARGDKVSWSHQPYAGPGGPPT